MKDFQVLPLNSICDFNLSPRKHHNAFHMLDVREHVHRCYTFNGKPAVEKNFEVPGLRHNVAAHVHDFLLG